MEWKYLEHYIRNKKYHPGTPLQKRRGIRKASQNYMLSGGKLYYVKTGEVRKRLVCRNEREKKAALKWCHDNRAIGDICLQKDTIKRLNETFYWSGIHNELKGPLYECENCKLELQGLCPDSSMDQLSVIASGGDMAFADDDGNMIYECAAEEEVDPDGNGEGDSIMEQCRREVVGSVIQSVKAENETDVEALMEKITELATKNAILVKENNKLKGKVRSLHRVLENQQSLPALSSLIDQLKQSLPATITTTITNIAGEALNGSN